MLTASQIDWARLPTASPWTPGATIANSSPPMRARVSLERSIDWARSATWRRMASPTGWPWLSLIVLKLSRSRISRASGLRRLGAAGIGGELPLQHRVELAAVGDPGERVAVGDVALVELGLEQPLPQPDQNPGRREEAGGQSDIVREEGLFDRVAVVDERGAGGEDQLDRERPRPPRGEEEGRVEEGQDQHRLHEAHRPPGQVDAEGDDRDRQDHPDPQRLHRGAVPAEPAESRGHAVEKDRAAEGEDPTHRDVLGPRQVAAGDGDEGGEDPEDPGDPPHSRPLVRRFGKGRHRDGREGGSGGAIPPHRSPGGEL